MVRVGAVPDTARVGFLQSPVSFKSSPWGVTLSPSQALLIKRKFHDSADQKETICINPPKIIPFPNQNVALFSKEGPPLKKIATISIMVGQNQSFNLKG